MSEYVVVDRELIDYLVKCLSPVSKANICPALNDCPQGVKNCVECLVQHSGKIKSFPASALFAEEMEEFLEELETYAFLDQAQIRAKAILADIQKAKGGE